MPVSDKKTEMNPKPTKIKLDAKLGLILLIIVAIVIAVFVFTPNTAAAFFTLFLFVFILAFSAGAQTQLKAIRRMTDSPKSTIRGASQGNVELAAKIQPPEDSPYFDLQNREQKGYWKFSIKKKVDETQRWEHVISFTSHTGYLPLHDQDAICWADLSIADFHPLKNEVQFSATQLADFEKKHPILSAFKAELKGAQNISFTEEWLPGDKTIFSIGYFSSSPSSSPPSHLNEEQKPAWLTIARKTEGTEEGTPLKGTVTVNTLTMSKFGIVYTPVILSIFSESQLKRKTWFKFWLIIFSILVLLTLPVLFLLDHNGLL